MACMDIEKEKRAYKKCRIIIIALFVILCGSLLLVCLSGRSITSYIKEFPILKPRLELLRRVVTEDAVFKLGEALGIGSVLLVWIYNSMDKEEMGTLYSELLEEVYPGYYIFVLVHLGSFGACLWMAKAGRIATASWALFILVVGSFIQCRTLKGFVLSPENRKQIALHRWRRLVCEVKESDPSKGNERLRELIFSMADAVILDAGSHCEELLEVIVGAIQKYIGEKAPENSEDWKWVLLDISGFWNDILEGRSANDQTIILRKMIQSYAEMETKEALCVGYVLWRYDWRLRKTDYEVELQRPIEALASEVTILTERTFARGRDPDNIFYCFEAAFHMLVEMHAGLKTIDRKNEFSKLIPRGEEGDLERKLLYGFAKAVFSKETCDRSRELKRYQRMERTWTGSRPERAGGDAEKLEIRLYVVVLEKISRLQAKCFEKEEGFSRNEEVWITMGHFDAMHTYEVNMEKGLFQAIEENNKVIFERQKSGRYFHPLYLISTEGEELGLTGESPFVAVARIHFSESVDSEKTYNELRNKLKEKAERKKYKCQTFQTVELSDMILTVSAERLCDVLEFALTMREYSAIGKVYTYAGINYGALKKGIDLKEADKISLFSMRFSVLDFEKINSCVKEVRRELGEETCYSVAGVDDIMLNWKELEVCRLVELYRKWFVEGVAPMENGSFSEVTTRVGIYQEEAKEKGSEDDLTVGHSGKLLIDCCKRLLEQSRKVQTKYKESSWAAPLGVLANTLVRISETAVLDEFVYIMYEGIDAFLRNVAEKDIPGVELYQEFVENGVHLMEHVIRVEGQLSHDPEMRPMVYDIPVAMLEYTLAFLKQVSTFLQEADGEEKAEIRFLLVPRLCERIMAQELFSAEPGILPGLVMVTIPVELLYNAKEIQMALCHEVSHFVGENCRGREGRRKKYVQAVACLIAKEVFQYKTSYIEAIQEGLLKKTDDMKSPCVRDMRERVLEWIAELWGNEATMSHFVEVVRRNGNEEEGLEEKIRGAFREERLVAFEELLVDIGDLFREVYADICMLHILEISSEDYVGSMIEELNKNQEEDRRYEAIAVRVYAALDGVGKAIPSVFIKERSEELYRQIERFRGLNQETAGKERFEGVFPRASVWFLDLYAKKCYKSLCNLEGKDKIRKMFSNATAVKMDYKSFMGDIDWYRKGILGMVEA